MLAAGANEIAYAIRSAARPRNDVIDVQDLITGTVLTGVRASVVEFDQHVFAQFKALELALLILDAFDCRVLH